MLNDEQRAIVNVIYDKHVRPGSSVQGSWIAIAEAFAAGAADMRERAKLLAFAASDANQDDLVLFGVLRQLGADISALPGEAP